MATLAVVILALAALVKLSSLRADLARLDERIARLERETIRSPDAQPVRPATAASVSDAPPVARLDPEPAPFFAHPAPQPPATTHQEPATVSAAAAAADSTLETAIGSRWMLIAGVVVLVLGVGFFVKYAFDNDWITPSMRVAAGTLAGAALIVAGLRFIRRGYKTYGRLLAGGGFAVLYLSTYAAFTFYGLIGPTAEFALLFLISLGAAAAADWSASLGLALFAVCGGFAAPFFLGGPSDQQVALFSYDLVLVALTLVLAERRDWPQLNLASFALTIATIFAWAAAFYTPAKYLRTEIFLSAFCALFLWILRRNMASRHPVAPLATLFLSVGPLLYHSASVEVLTPHSVAFLVYSVAVTAIVVGAARASGRAWPRLVATVLVVVPLFGWLGDHIAARWLMPATAAFTAIYLLHLTAIADAIAHRDEALSAADIAVFHIAGLTLFASSYMLLDTLLPDWAAPIAFGLAAWHVALAVAIVRVNVDAALNGAALAAAMLAAALAIAVSGPWLTIGWAVEGAGLLWLALRTERRWLHAGAIGFVAVAALRAVDASLRSPSIDFVPLVNAVFAAGAVSTAVLYWIGVQHRRAQWLGASAETLASGAFVAANILTLVVISGQINAVWQVRASARNAELARQLMLSVAWGIYAAGLVAVGMRRGAPALRYLGLALFGLTVGKAFAVDLAELGGLYRIAAFVLVGLLLLWASYLYQTLLTRARGRESPGSTPMPSPPAETPIQ